jgi:thioredoxin-dependent peroxiredoxin
VAYFGVSVDPPETNKSFAQALGIDYPLLSDPAKKVAAAYGVVDEDQPFPSRWTFYIGADGRILFIDKQVSPATHGTAIARKLAELGVPRRRPGANHLFAGARMSRPANESRERRSSR